MFNFLKKAEEPELKPQIIDPVKLAQKQDELTLLIKKAAEDGVITPVEDAQISQLAVLVGINKTGIKKMINAELLPQFKAQIEKFASDGNFDDLELKAIRDKANELEVSDADVAMMMAEALSHHDADVKKKITRALSVMGVGLVAVGAILSKVLLEMSANGNLKHTMVQHRKG